MVRRNGEREKNYVITKITKQIEVFEQLREALLLSEPVIKAYEGKIVNNRLLNDLKKIACKMRYSLNDNYLIISNFDNRYFDFYEHKREIVWDYEIKLKLEFDSEKRLLYSEKMELNFADLVVYVENEILNCKNDILLYDEEIKEHKHIEELVNNYIHKYSNRLKRYIFLQERKIPFNL